MHCYYDPITRYQRRDVRSTRRWLMESNIVWFALWRIAWHHVSSQLKRINDDSIPVKLLRLRVAHSNYIWNRFHGFTEARWYIDVGLSLPLTKLTLTLSIFLLPKVSESIRWSRKVSMLRVANFGREKVFQIVTSVEINCDAALSFQPTTGVWCWWEGERREPLSLDELCAPVKRSLFFLRAAFVFSPPHFPCLYIYFSLSSRREMNASLLVVVVSVVVPLDSIDDSPKSKSKVTQRLNFFHKDFLSDVNNFPCDVDIPFVILS